MNTETETNRREFEEWAESKNFSLPKGNRYISPATEIAWEAWQAARERVTEQRDSIDSMYHKIIKEVLECDPIPACQREDDQLEPPWEVIARIRKQRDRLAEALRKAISWGDSASHHILYRENINWTYLDEAREALQSLTPKDHE
jgi:hypothetical protein